MKVAAPALVRASIARHVLGLESGVTTLGHITLLPHQREAIDRVQRLLDSHGGALLADDVGLGKTFVALAVARAAADPVVVAPAALQVQWLDAARRADVRLRFRSLESFSRGATLSAAPDLVIVDEAHHLRTRRTRRFRRVSALCAHARVLLLSATPVQNRLEDLRTLLALFLGERAGALREDELARFVVRRAGADLDLRQPMRLPRVLAPQWIAIDDVDCLDRLLALPPPLPPIDGTDGGILLVYTLARQWASSRRAFVAALTRRLARGAAMEDALLAGRRPTRAELTAWGYADGAQQLAFPEVMVARDLHRGGAALLDQVRRHMDAVRELLAFLRSASDPDPRRADALCDLADRHPGERIIAFSEFADTVSALYRLVQSRARAAMLTHAGGRVAGGPIGRGEALARFAPGAGRAAAMERIDLLLTTDVLSEGVNLQGASVVVHLDLAWNPARLEQRVGRLRRLGSARDAVAVYAMTPPAPAERLLALERRLRAKTALAARAIGVAGAILPGMPHSERAASGAAAESRLMGALARWRSTESSDEAVACAVWSPRRAAIACVSHGGSVSLLAVLEDRITDARAVVEDLIAHAEGAGLAVDPQDLAGVTRRLDCWLRRRAIAAVVDLPALRVGRSRRDILRRADAIARRTPRHARPAVASLVHAARSAAQLPLPAGAEVVLTELAHAPLADAAWLQAVSEFAAVHGGRTAPPPAILALILLRGDEPRDAGAG